MHEILFRGKRKDNGKWVEGYYMDEGYINQPFEVDPETVGPYIDLADKKIGENDIVEINRENHRYIGVVKLGKYNTYHYGFYIDWINGSEMLSEELLYWLPKIKVIGNIHDNPELLK